MRYVLDTNVFIDAANRYYAFDIAPGFWDSLALLAQIGSVRSIDRVYQELSRHEDGLYDWAGNSFSVAFQSTDRGDVTLQYGQVMRWVHQQEQYFDAAIYDFAEGADGWLVAYAKICDCTLITHEAYNNFIKRKVPLPKVCVAVDVPYTDPFTMLRELGVELHFAGFDVPAD
jgi:hypothetical protein